MALAAPCRTMLLRTTTAAPRRTLFLAARTTTRPAASRVAAPPALETLRPRQVRHGRLESQVMDQYRQNKDKMASGRSPTAGMRQLNRLAETRNVFLLPGNLAPLPLRSWPRSPKLFLRYLTLRTKSLLTNLLLRTQVRYSSLQNWRSRWRPRRARLVPTAKSLHRRMNEALAAGDLHALGEVCHPPLVRLLGRAVQARPRNQVLEWQVAAYNRPLLYPRVVLHRIMELPVQPGMGGRDVWLQESAIVALETTQRLVRRDAGTGEQVKGGLRVETKRENVLLVRGVNGRTWEADEWKIWGMEDGKTLGEWEEFEKNVQAQQAVEIKRRLGGASKKQ